MALDITRRFKARSSSSHFSGVGVLATTAEGGNLGHENGSGSVAKGEHGDGDDSGAEKKTEPQNGRRNGFGYGHEHGQALAPAAAEGVTLTTTDGARRE